MKSNNYYPFRQFFVPESYKFSLGKHTFIETEFPIKHLSFTLSVIFWHQFSINTLSFNNFNN